MFFFVHFSGVPAAAAEIDHGAVDGLDSILVARPFLMVFSGSDKNWKVLPCRYHAYFACFSGLNFREHIA
jgi:hypothetical protein